MRDFRDSEEIRRAYYREAAELALAATGARRAYVFDHLVRRRDRDRAAVSFGRKGAGGGAAVNGRIHNDYTEASGRRRFGLVLPDERAAEPIRRYVIVNVWRSISGPCSTRVGGLRRARGDAHGSAG